MHIRRNNSILSKSFFALFPDIPIMAIRMFLNAGNAPAKKTVVFYGVPVDRYVEIAVAGRLHRV
jgi:hypothetical protein